MFNRQLFNILSFMKTNILNRIGGVMVSMLASSAVDRGFKPVAKHATLSRKNKDWLAQNQNNVSEWIRTVVSVS